VYPAFTAASGEPDPLDAWAEGQGHTPRELVSPGCDESGREGDRAKMVVVSQSPGALKGTEDYIAHLDHLVSALAAALK